MPKGMMRRDVTGTEVGWSLVTLANNLRSSKVSHATPPPPHRNLRLTTIPLYHCSVGEHTLTPPTPPTSSRSRTYYTLPPTLPYHTPSLRVHPRTQLTPLHTHHTSWTFPLYAGGTPLLSMGPISSTACLATGDRTCKRRAYQEEAIGSCKSSVALPWANSPSRLQRTS